MCVCVVGGWGGLVDCLAAGHCSLLDVDVEVNSEQLLKKKISRGDVVNGVVEQVRYTHTHTHTHSHNHMHTLFDFPTGAEQWPPGASLSKV